jgi:hypothetical protein
MLGIALAFSNHLVIFREILGIPFHNESHEP